MKNRFIATFFAFFFGGIALNEFYVGNTKTAIIELVLSILFCWCFGLGPLVVGIINTVKGCMYLWCNSNDEFIDKYVNTK